MLDVHTAHVDCWLHPNDFRILYKLLEGLGTTYDIHRSTPTDELLQRLRAVDRPYLIVLDETDQLDDPDLLRRLYAIPDVTMILITNHERGLDTIALLEGWSFLSDLMSAYEPGPDDVELPVIGAIGNVVALYVLRTRQTGSVDDIPAEALEYLFECSSTSTQSRPWRESTAVGWGLGHDDISVTESVHQALSNVGEEWAIEALKHAFYADQHAAVNVIQALDSSLLSELSNEFLKVLPKPNAWPPGPSGAWWEEFGYQFQLDEQVHEQVVSLVGA